MSNFTKIMANQQRKKRDVILKITFTFIFIYLFCLPFTDGKDDKSNMIYSSQNYKINENPDKCAMLNQVQSVVIQLLGSHYEYGKGIETLMTVTDTIQTDLVAIKNQVNKMQNGTKSWKEKMKKLLDNDTNKFIKSSHLKQPMTYNITHELKSFSSHDIDKDEILKPSGLSRSVHPTNKDLLEDIKNLTKHIHKRDQTIANSEKQMRKIRRNISHLQTRILSLSEVYKNNSAEQQSLKHFLKRQKIVNGQLLNRVHYLEEHMKQMTQNDSPNLQPNGCPNGFIRHILSCYKFMNETKNWIEAEKFCQSLQTHCHLVGIETAEEENFIINVRNYNKAHWSSMYIWTGANDIGKENGWTWVSTGDQLEYTNWRPGQPDNHNSEWQHCIYLRTDSHDHRWDDWHCHAAKLNFVCEINLQAT